MGIPQPRRLTTDETLAMIKVMAALARDEADTETDDGYWDGWAAGLEQLAKHITAGVKPTCFPIGNCTCHPLEIRSSR